MLLSKKGIRLNNGGASSGGVIRFGLMNIKEFRASDLDVMQKSKNKNAPMGRFVFMCLRFCLKEKNYSGLFVSVDRG